MKRSTLLSVTAALTMISAAWAQPPEGGRDREGPPPREGREGRPSREGREGGPEGRPPFRFPPAPLMVALDADADGEISAAEIEGAVAALKKLDKNSDGKLTREELRPDFRGREEGFGPREGGPRGGFRGREGDREGGGREGGFRGPEGGREGGGREGGDGPRRRRPPVEDEESE
jgi:hypothetical protein